MNPSAQRAPQNPPGISTRRRNLRTALLLGMVAAGFYIAFFFAVSHRGG